MVRKKSRDQDIGQGPSSKKDLEVLVVPPKGFWETVRYFGKGIRESRRHAFLVIVALILLVATLPAMYLAGTTYAFVSFVLFLVVLLIILQQGANIQKAGLKREIGSWTKANRAEAHFEEPARDFERTSLATRATLKKCLEVYRDFVAVFLNLQKNSVRTNIFRPSENGVLVIPTDMHFNMDDPNEVTIELPPGEGCTGSAYSLRKPIIATRETREFPYGVPRPERAKVSENLQWILSLPIFAGGRVIGVLNADGVYTPKTKGEVRGIIPSVRPWADLIGNLLESQGSQ